jgi:DNA polymerase-3 subunit beta
MQLVINQEPLKQALAIVMPAVASKGSLPVLSNIALTAAGDDLTLAATNLEVGITHRVAAQVGEAGTITLPARLLSDVVTGLPPEAITLTLDPKSMTVKLACAGFVTNIKGIDAEEFPTIPTVSETTAAISVPAAVLRAAIPQVAIAAASDHTRPVLTGVLLRVRGNRLTLAAADGFRLARKHITLPQKAAKKQEQDRIIPAPALAALARTLPDAGEVAIRSTADVVVFQTERTAMVTRLIDGKFPDFERVIPAECSTRAVLDTQELSKAVKLAALFAGESQHLIKVTVTPGTAQGQVTICTSAVSTGDNTGDLLAEVRGSGFIGLNVTYLRDAINAVGGSQVVMELNSPQQPGVLKPGQAGDDYVHIIMPMAIR